MFDDLATNPNVASICFGNPRGDAIYLQRAHGRLEYGIADGAKDCAAIEWPVDATGKVQRDKVDPPVQVRSAHAAVVQDCAAQQHAGVDGRLLLVRRGRQRIGDRHRLHARDPRRRQAWSAC